ncbi:hypothetical protein Tco_0536006 [Tanacetum coccineum]
MATFGISTSVATWCHVAVCPVDPTVDQWSGGAPTVVWRWSGGCPAMVNGGSPPLTDMAGPRYCSYEVQNSEGSVQGSEETGQYKVIISRLLEGDVAARDWLKREYCSWQWLVYSLSNNESVGAAKKIKIPPDLAIRVDEDLK